MCGFSLQCLNATNLSNLHSTSFSLSLPFPACSLVAASEVPKTGNWFADFMLWLPTAATAVLPMKLEFATAAEAEAEAARAAAATAATAAPEQQQPQPA